MSGIEYSIDRLLGADRDPVAVATTLQEVGQSEPSLGLELLAEMARRSDELVGSDPAIIGALLRGIHILALRDDRAAIKSFDSALIAVTLEALPAKCTNRHLLLHLLALAQSDAALSLLTSELTQSPPHSWLEVGQVLSPLLQGRSWNVLAIFPGLLDAIEHQSIASPLIDLANFVFRSNIVKIHPAKGRIATLNRLLGAVTARLEKFERDPTTFGDEITVVQERLSHAVSLSVSLCDALGLIGDASSLSHLKFAMQLRHRRVQCEAAGALARMGDTAGRDQLIGLASEPSARLRVIAYAEELDIDHQVEPKYRTDAALAESELAIWLSQPDRFGVPPTSIETVDERRLLWPGYADLVECFLIRFAYELGTRSYSNIGLAGPAVYAMACDLADFQVDDIYAIYAGWQAEHDDIFAIAANQFTAGQRRIADELQVHLEREGYEEMKAELFGVFLEEHAVIYSASRVGKSCRVLTDGLETIPLSISSRARPLQPVDLWNLYKGRKMLRTFNS